MCLSLTSRAEGRLRRRTATSTRCSRSSTSKFGLVRLRFRKRRAVADEGGRYREHRYARRTCLRTSTQDSLGQDAPTYDQGPFLSLCTLPLADSEPRRTSSRTPVSASTTPRLRTLLQSRTLRQSTMRGSTSMLISKPRARWRLGRRRSCRRRCCD